MGTIEESIKRLKELKPFNPEFEICKSTVLTELDYELGTGDISIREYKAYLAELNDIDVSIVNLVSVELIDFISKDFKIKIDVESVLEARKFLDENYETLRKVEKTKNNINEVAILPLLKQLQKENFDGAYELFYCIICYIRCHTIEEMSFLNPQHLGLIFNRMHRNSMQIFKEKDMHSLEAFGSVDNIDLNTSVIANVVVTLLNKKDFSPVLNYVEQILKSYYEPETTEYLNISLQIAELLKYFFYVEDDYEELFKMIKTIKKYSKLSIYDVIGENILNKIINYIDDYFFKFSDLDCYNFVVRNKLYFSNAVSNDAIRSTRKEISELLQRYEIVDYDNVGL